VPLLPCRVPVVSAGRRHFVPHKEGTCSQQPLMRRPKQVAPHAKEIRRSAECTVVAQTRRAGALHLAARRGGPSASESSDSSSRAADGVSAADRRTPSSGVRADRGRTLVSCARRPRPIRIDGSGVRPALLGPPRPSCSSVAQRQSIRLLTGGLLVRIQPEEPIPSGPFRTHG
jgi:hypothetical protein